MKLSIRRYFHSTRIGRIRSFDQLDLHKHFSSPQTKTSAYIEQVQLIKLEINSKPKPLFPGNLTHTLKKLLLEASSQFEYLYSDDLLDSITSQKVIHQYPRWVPPLRMETVSDAIRVRRLQGHIIKTKLCSQYLTVRDTRTSRMQNELHPIDPEMKRQVQMSADYRIFTRELYKPVFTETFSGKKVICGNYHHNLKVAYDKLPRPAPSIMRFGDLETFIRRMMFCDESILDSNFAIELLQDFKDAKIKLSFRELLKFLKWVLIKSPKHSRPTTDVGTAIENALMGIYENYFNRLESTHTEFFNGFLNISLAASPNHVQEELLIRIVRDMIETGTTPDRLTITYLLRLSIEKQKPTLTLDLVEYIFTNCQLELELIQLMVHSLIRISEHELASDIMRYYLKCCGIDKTNDSNSIHFERENLYEKDLDQYILQIRTIEYLSNLLLGENVPKGQFLYHPELSSKLINQYLWFSKDQSLNELFHEKGWGVSIIDAIEGAAVRVEFEPEKVIRFKEDTYDEMDTFGDTKLL